MSSNKENIDDLDFLSMEFKNKLKKIASEMSSFLLLSTFRDMERDWFHADRKAFDAVKNLFEMMGDRISELIKEMFDDGLVLASTQKRSVLKYLYVETEKNRTAIRLPLCSRTFFEKIFNKYSPDTDGTPSPNNNKRSRQEKMPIGRMAAFKKIKLNPKVYIALTFKQVGVFPTLALNGSNEKGKGAFQTTYGNELYKTTPRNTVDENANSLTVLPSNKTVRSEEKNADSKSANQKSTNLWEASSSKACKEEKKQKMKNEQGLNSVVDRAAAVKKEENELKKPIKHEAEKKVAKQNRGHELFGNDSDDAEADSDVEITGSYTVAIPDEKKFVSFNKSSIE